MVALIFAEIVSSGLRDRRAALANSLKHQAHFATTGPPREEKEIRQTRKLEQFRFRNSAKRFKFHTAETVLT
jgi:hypothetical protein